MTLAAAVLHQDIHFLNYYKLMYANCAVSGLTNLTNMQRAKNVVCQKVSHLFYYIVVWNLTTSVI
ncbi:MAG TPA: hypothetical protein ACFYEF_13160, partial [Candidatus Wunengus sp. YC63]|uniref:hypothetical protein n=1 Tax=Candidatus Wunengus sp. YC63 TaxID=3367699 RepID=UPI00402546DA